MAKVSPKTIDSIYVSVRQKLGKSLGGSSAPTPTPTPPGVVIEENDGSPTGRVQTISLDIAAATGGFTLAIVGDLGTVGLQPIFLLLDGSRPMLGDLDMGGFDLENHGAGGLRDIVTMRNIVSMVDITSMQDITAMRDVVSMRDVVAMRWIQSVDEVAWNVGASPSAAYPHESAIHQSFESVEQAKGLALDTDVAASQIYLGRKLIVRAYNPSVENTFAVGDPIVILGDTSSGLKIASPTSTNVKLGKLGLVAVTTPTTSFSQVVLLGAMKMDTSAFAVGDTLWFKVSPPGLTATEPPVDGLAGHFRARLATVLVSDASGWVYVQPDDAQFERRDEKGVAFGYAPLDSRKMVPSKHLPLAHHFLFLGQ